MQFGNLNGRKSTKAVEPTGQQRKEATNGWQCPKKDRKLNKVNLFEGIHQELEESRIVAYHVDLVEADVRGECCDNRILENFIFTRQRCLDWEQKYFVTIFIGFRW